MWKNGTILTTPTTIHERKTNNSPKMDKLLESLNLNLQA
jgi:hypothetical protein